MDAFGASADAVKGKLLPFHDIGHVISGYDVDPQGEILL